MKTFQQFIFFFFRDRTERKPPQPGIVETVPKASSEPVTKPERRPSPDDDSPPGYKVRWHQ